MEDFENRTEGVDDPEAMGSLVVGYPGGAKARSRDTYTGPKGGVGMDSRDKKKEKQLD